MNDISEGYEFEAKSFTGPLNTTIGANPRAVNSTQKPQSQVHHQGSYYSDVKQNPYGSHVAQNDYTEPGEPISTEKQFTPLHP